MATVRTLISGLLVIAVMLATLALGAPSADAIEAGPVCETGVLTADNRCEIAGEHGDGANCPAIEDGDDCYRLVSAELVCPPEAPLTEGMCRLPVPDSIEPPTCEAPYDVTNDGRCITVVPGVEDFECALGTYDEAVASCIDDFGPPEILGGCPGLEDADGCYVLVSATERCPDGAVENDAGCFVLIEPIPGPLACPNADANVEVEIDGELHCGVQTAVEVDCGDSEFTFHIGDGVCRESLPFEDQCAVYLEIAQFSLVEFGGDCYDVVFDLLGDCPSGFEPNLTFEACARLLGPAGGCPVDYEFDGEQCFRTFDGVVDCPADFPDFLRFERGRAFCWRDYGPLVSALSCPPATIEIGENCGRPIQPIFECIVGDLVDTDVCRIAEEPLPGVPFCPVGAVVDGRCIVYYGPPEFVFFCPEGIDIGLACEIEGPPPTEEVSCLGAMGSPGGCYIEIPPLAECPAGTTPDTIDPFDCREPVDRIGDDCGFGFDPTDGECLRYEDPLWFCAGQEVTINMTLGDPGVGTSGADVILGTGGPDLIRANGGNDLVCALGGADTVFGGNGRDRIYGGTANDTVYGGPGRDFLYGETGEDTLNGGRGGDDLIGGPDNDTLNGGRGRDSVQGGSGNDILNGNGGRDVLIGSTGNDMLFGGSGRDYLKAGAGIDTCDGQGNADSFRDCETIADP